MSFIFVVIGRLNFGHFASFFYFRSIVIFFFFFAKRQNFFDFIRNCELIFGRWCLYHTNWFLTENAIILYMNSTANPANYFTLIKMIKGTNNGSSKSLVISKLCWFLALVFKDLSSHAYQ